MAQRFLIDRVTQQPVVQVSGSFCLPFTLTDAVSAPSLGEISFSPNNTLTSSSIVAVNPTTKDGNDLWGFLTGSTKGKLQLYNRQDPTNYAIFSYFGVAKYGDYALFSVSSGSITGSIGYSSETPFEVGDELCFDLDYNLASQQQQYPQYQTGSDPFGDLLQLTILDYDPNVFVTSSNGHLTLQFGIPRFPEITSFTATGFATDRFNCQPDTNGYTLNTTFALNGTTYVAGTYLTQSSTLVGNYSDGISPDSFYVNATTLGSQPLTGSQYFTTSLQVTREDGSSYTTQETLNLVLNKTEPGNPTISATLDIEQDAYSGLNIEYGATGSIDYEGIATTQFRQWEHQPVSFSLDPASPVTVNQTNTINLEVTEHFQSPEGLNCPQIFIDKYATRTYNRPRSIRFGRSTDLSFTNTLSSLTDISKWYDEASGSIDVGIVNPHEYAGAAPGGTANAYHFIVYDANRPPLTQIFTPGVGVVYSTTSNPPKTEFFDVYVVGGLYRVYKTTAIQVPGVVEYILYTS